MTKRFIRVDKKNTAFVYAILESLEGAASFSTLDSSSDPQSVGKTYRDLEICIADGFEDEVSAAIAGMAKEFPIIDITESHQ